jgi:hypothetical protein
VVVRQDMGEKNRHERKTNLPASYARSWWLVAHLRDKIYVIRLLGKTWGGKQIYAHLHMKRDDRNVG